jgi:hypothetical protein
MEFSDKQKEDIAFAIRRLDSLQPSYDEAFDSFEKGKVKFGLSLFASSSLFVTVLFGNQELERGIGMLGVAALPIIAFISVYCIYSLRKKYHNIITEQLNLKQLLFDIGLSYNPTSRLIKKRWLIVLETKEELDINEFI